MSDYDPQKDAPAAPVGACKSCGERLEQLEAENARMVRKLRDTEVNAGLRLARLIEANDELEAYRARDLIGDFAK